MNTPKHELLKKKSSEAIEELFGDTSVSQQQTLDSLHELRDDITAKIQCIENDLED